MTSNNEAYTLLSRVLDQQIQLFDLTSKIDAKANQLETQQDQIKPMISGVKKDNSKIQTTLQELQLKVNTIDAIQGESNKRREQRFSWLLSLALIIVSSICSYLLYLLR